MNNNNLDILEQKAAEQRKAIHRSVDEARQLRVRVESNVREKLDPKRQARQHFWAVAGAAAFLGLVLGNGLIGVFVD